MLRLDGVQAAYGPSQALFGISLHLAEGEALGLLGRNGMGKTTTIRTIVGALRPLAGSIAVAGTPIAGLGLHRICRLGVGYVPEGRRIFRHLTVHEQLAAFARSGRDGRSWSTGQIYDLFPALVPRRHSPGGLLSGGEQQMLAIGRALMTGPSLLILDEATEGLAPLIRQRIWDGLKQLKAQGLAILVVDKNLHDVLGLVDAVVVLEKGRVAWTGSGQMLRDDDMTQRRLLSL